MHELRSVLVRGERRTTLASKARPAAGGRAGGLGAINIRRGEARRCNQRQEDRKVSLVEQAIIRVQRKLHEVPVLNVSSRGAMIAADLQPRIGARIAIRFADCNETFCLVRWVRGGRIGLEFERETLVIAADDSCKRLVSGRRQGEHPTFELRKQRAPRQSSMLVAQLHWPAGSATVRLRNISSSGAMIHAGDDLDVDCEVVLELPAVAAIPGKVKWCRAHQVGIAFDENFDLDRLTRPQRPAERVDYVKPDYLRDETDPGSPWAARWTRLTAGDL